jgi:hypothetical protein
MDKHVKELVGTTSDEHLRVFVRACPIELTKGDLEFVAGGRRAMLVPNG